MKHIRSLVERFFSKHSSDVSVRLAKVWAHWDKVIGTDLAEYAKPLGHKKTCLLLGVEDSIVMQEITMHGATIMSRINQFLGVNYFDKVKVELIRGRSALDKLDVQGGSSQKEPRIPEDLGGLLDVMPENSAIGRSYRAYIGLAKETQD